MSPLGPAAAGSQGGPEDCSNLVFESHDGLGANQVEKREPESGIDTAVVDSLKALDLERPIREAD